MAGAAPGQLRAPDGPGPCPNVISGAGAAGAPWAEQLEKPFKCFAPQSTDLTRRGRPKF